MKRIALSAVLFFCGMYIAFAQVGINPNGSPPDPSAGLDVNFENRGLLIPRMTTAQRNGISNPAVGLQIFNTTTMCFEYFAYGVWQNLSCAVCPLPSQPSSISGAVSVCQGAGGVGYSVSALSGATSYSWSYSGTGVSVSGSSNSVSLSFNATATSGTLSVAGVNACGTGPVQTLEITVISSYLDTPSSGTHAQTASSVTWNWNPVAGATGYRFGSSANYALASDLGNVTSFPENALSCGSSLTRYVWAYNSCGNSSPQTLSSSTLSCFNCGNSVTFFYKGQNVTYGTVSGQNGTCWMDRNLGADQVATAYNDINAVGDWFQWGRLDDGHQTRTSPTLNVKSSTPVPGHSSYIGNLFYEEGNHNWIDPPNNSLWQGQNGINNPCPAGWRVPSRTEWDNERNSWVAGQSVSGSFLEEAFESPLKLVASGYRGNWGPNSPGNSGFYWSQTISGSTNYSYFLFIGTDNCYTDHSTRIDGMSVRCILNQ